MANNLSSNVTRKLARVFLEGFDEARVITKSINTQLLSNRFDPSSGSTVDFKRPHDYKTIRQATGDLTGETKSDIIAGKATGTVQPYFTTATEWSNLEQAIELDQLDEILKPMARRMVTDLEVDMAKFMMLNSGLSVGTPGTVVDAWSDVANASALMENIGVPTDQQWCYAMNPNTQVALANKQTELSTGDPLVKDAWQRAMISSDFAGFRVMKSTALHSITTAAGADKAGQLKAAPDQTYVTAKDTMVQILSLKGMTNNLAIKAGEIIEVTGRHRLSNATRLPIVDAAGNQVKFRCTVIADVTLNGSGEGSVFVTGPAIFEAAGGYNTVDSALAINDVVTIISPQSTFLQPNMFWHPQAFGIGTVKLPKLYSTDTVATTKDGFSIRISKYADGDKNKQMVRYDMLPAFAVFNPSFAGQGYGS